MNQNDYTSFISPKKMLQLQLPEALDASMADNINDTFMTADESGNNTQFFSVLENSSTTILDSISYENLVGDEHEFTFTNTSDASVSEKHTVAEDAAEDEGNMAEQDQELIIFKSPHSSKLFGLQTTQDDDGNMQKYQYEVIQNDEGQYESIPGTIHLVPFETDPSSVIRQMELQQEETDAENAANNNDNSQVSQSSSHFDSCPEEVFIKEEDAGKEVYITGMDDEDALDTLEQDDKVISDFCMNLQQAPEVELEQEQEIDENSLEQPKYQNIQDIQDQEDTLNEDEEATADMKQGILENALKGIYSPLKAESEPNLVFVDEADQELMVEEPQEEEQEEENVINLHDIQNGSGHRTIALYPITKDAMLKQGGSGSCSNTVVTTIELPPLQRTKYMVTTSGAVRKGPLKSLNSLKRPHGGNVSATVANAVISPQKENLEVTKQGIAIIKKNIARKTLLNKQNSVGAVGAVSDAEAIVKEAIVAKDKPDKRKQPQWNVNKMISQTTIIEAPVRQERLPRKQKIEPLDRVGEELEFQHVTVSASGVIETKVDGVVKTRKVLEPSECIQLSDNEDDFTRKSRKRNAKKKQIEIVISDSEEGEGEDKAEGEVENKKQEQELEQQQERPQSASDTGLALAIPEKEANECPKCSKSFPSIGSLKTHLQSHMLEERKKDAALDTFEKGKSKQLKHKCSKCPETFINAFLRNKHEQLHEVRTRIECVVCKRLFGNAMLLNAHKKTHATAVTERRSMRSSTKAMEACAKETQKSTKTQVQESAGAVAKSPVKKSKVSLSLKRRTGASTSRRSLMPPPGGTGVASNTRRTLLPSKMPIPSTFGTSAATGLTRLQTRASGVPSTSSGLPRQAPFTSTRLSTTKVFRCLSCKSTFSNKLALDEHIIKNCVKSPRLTRNSTLNTDNTVETQTNAHAPKTRSKSCSTTVYSHRRTLQAAKSTHSLSITVGAAAGPSTRSAKTSAFARRRIPTNAGIPVNPRMLGALMNIRRKLMEDSDEEEDTDASGDHGDAKDKQDKPKI